MAWVFGLDLQHAARRAAVSYIKASVEPTGAERANRRDWLSVRGVVEPSEVVDAE